MLFLFWMFDAGKQVISRSHHLGRNTMLVWEKSFATTQIAAETTEISGLWLSFLNIWIYITIVTDQAFKKELFIIYWMMSKGVFVEKYCQIIKYTIGMPFLYSIYY